MSSQSGSARSAKPFQIGDEVRPRNFRHLAHAQAWGIGTVVAVGDVVYVKFPQISSLKLFIAANLKPADSFAEWITMVRQQAGKS